MDRKLLFGVSVVLLGSYILYELYKRHRPNPKDLRERFHSTYHPYGESCMQMCTIAYPRVCSGSPQECTDFTACMDVCVNNQEDMIQTTPENIDHWQGQYGKLL